MHFFHVHPNDARWLGRWLRSNIAGMLVICAALLLLRSGPRCPRSISLAADTQPVSRTAQVPPLNSTRSLAPVGWRLTKTGWEDSSTWAPLPKSLGHWIELQEAREPVWIKTALANLRDVPPLAFGLSQLAAIAVIVQISKRRPEQPVGD